MPSRSAQRAPAQRDRSTRCIARVFSAVVSARSELRPAPPASLPTFTVFSFVLRLHPQDGFTPLHHASRNSCHEVALILLEHGADPQAQSVRRRTLLVLAASLFEQSRPASTDILQRRSSKLQVPLLPTSTPTSVLLPFAQTGCLCWCHKTPMVLSKTPRMKAILSDPELMSPSGKRHSGECVPLHALSSHLHLETFERHSLSCSAVACDLSFLHSHPWNACLPPLAAELSRGSCTSLWIRC